MLPCGHHRGCRRSRLARGQGWPADRSGPTAFRSAAALAARPRSRWSRRTGQSRRPAVLVKAVRTRSGALLHRSCCRSAPPAARRWPRSRRRWRSADSADRSGRARSGRSGPSVAQQGRARSATARSAAGERHRARVQQYRRAPDVGLPQARARAKQWRSRRPRPWQRR